MKKLLLMLALMCSIPNAAVSQTFGRMNPVSDINPQPVKSMCWTGSAFAACGGAAPPSTFWKYSAASGGIVNSASAVTVKAAAGASVRNYVMSMQCSHAALGAATELAIRDGAAGTVMWRGVLQTAATNASGATINFGPPLQGSANTLTEIVTLTAVTGGVYCNLQGYSGN